MPKYHVGCGLSAIYAGTSSKPGVWKDKTPVTDEAILAVAQWLLKEKMSIVYSENGKHYRMEINEVPTDGK